MLDINNGAEEGGTELIITTVGTFVNNADLTCLVGPSSGNATFISESAIRCVTPPGMGSVTVQVSNNGQNLVTAGENFTYASA